MKHSLRLRATVVLFGALCFSQPQAHGQFAAPVLGEPPHQVEFNGREYQLYKVSAPGVERHLYADADGNVLTAAELRAKVAAEKPQVVAPAVTQAITAGAATVEVIISPRSQPAGPLARNVRAASAAPRAALASAIRDATAQARIPAPPLLSRRELLLQRDALDRADRQEAYRRITTATQPNQAALAALVTQRGGTVSRRIGIGGAVVARVPAAAVDALAADPRVARIELDTPVEPELDLQRTSLGVDTTFWVFGFEGGVHDIGVLDTGVEQSHPALAGHPFLSNMGPDDTNGHGTSVCGIMASNDALAKGLAYGLDTIVVAMASGTISISMSGMDYIISTGEPELVNYSFGNGTANVSDYSTTDQFFDGVVDTFDFMVSKSAGNLGYSPGAPNISMPAPAYNIITTANVQDQNTIPRADDHIDVGSSNGPTVGGRKKPDLAAPGSQTWSPTRLGGFNSFGGTSSAAAHAGAGVILLRDAGVTSSLACKAILINTADAMTHSNSATPLDDAYVAGSFWDRRYGWGYMNLGRAYDRAMDHFVDSVPPAPETADFRLYAGAFAANDKATLVWNRHVAYNGTSFPTQIETLSDLDLRGYREADNVALANSSSAIDNVEQFSLASAEPAVVVKVEAFAAFDPDVPSEEFALATPAGFVARNGPAFSVNFSAPPGVAPGTQFTLTADITNTGDLAGHALSATLAGITIISGPNPAALGSLAAAGVTQASWVVEADDSVGTEHFSVAVTSNSYGEDFAGAGNGSYESIACTPGDVNNDGLINGDDVQAFVTVMTTPGVASAVEFCASDIVPTGSIATDDLEAFIGLLTN